MTVSTPGFKTAIFHDVKIDADVPVTLNVVLEVGGEHATGLADLLRKTWRVGAAGVDVPLTLARDGEVMEVRVHSANRHDFLRKPQLQ